MVRPHPAEKQLPKLSNFWAFIGNKSDALAWFNEGVAIGPSTTPGNPLVSPEFARCLGPADRRQRAGRVRREASGLAIYSRALKFSLRSQNSPIGLELAQFGISYDLQGLRY
jgi:hypothetical protein